MSPKISSPPLLLSVYVVASSSKPTIVDGSLAKVFKQIRTQDPIVSLALHCASLDDALCRLSEFSPAFASPCAVVLTDGSNNLIPRSSPACHYHGGIFVYFFPSEKYVATYFKTFSQLFQDMYIFKLHDKAPPSKRCNIEMNGIPVQATSLDTASEDLMIHKASSVQSGLTSTPDKKLSSRPEPEHEPRPSSSPIKHQLKRERAEKRLELHRQKLAQLAAQTSQGALANASTASTLIIAPETVEVAAAVTTPSAHPHAVTTKTAPHSPKALTSKPSKPVKGSGVPSGLIPITHKSVTAASAKTAKTSVSSTPGAASKADVAALAAQAVSSGMPPSIVRATNAPRPLPAASSSTTSATIPSPVVTPQMPTAVLGPAVLPVVTVEMAKLPVTPIPSGPASPKLISELTSAPIALKARIPDAVASSVISNPQVADESLPVSPVSLEKDAGSDAAPPATPTAPSNTCLTEAEHEQSPSESASSKVDSSSPCQREGRGLSGNVVEAPATTTPAVLVGASTVVPVSSGTTSDTVIDQPVSSRTTQPKSAVTPVKSNVVTVNPEKAAASKRALNAILKNPIVAQKSIKDVYGFSNLKEIAQRGLMAFATKSKNPISTSVASKPSSSKAASVLLGSDGESESSDDSDDDAMGSLVRMRGNKSKQAAATESQFVAAPVANQLATHSTNDNKQATNYQTASDKANAVNTRSELLALAELVAAPEAAVTPAKRKSRAELEQERMAKVANDALARKRKAAAAQRQRARTAAVSSENARSSSATSTLSALPAPKVIVAPQALAIPGFASASSSSSLINSVANDEDDYEGDD
ncbi:hypothetical protein CXG81DRAFT_21317 [Caulochytrium protostelioides]|uniref:Uncharacterized protein n=1 Tax=Caulochytrium protostelioides TaxID=1555241 RepID=A0A4P9WW73_9FUNG|nr:hypothetical protein CAUPRSCDRAFT_11532 [Caulochytrium protostelioides]RKO98447.1 hypothetical protein CXG81DRAFT_21317 [Caulochytrium protostelioides]|eukprot:RKO98447.1 hypothetical protein CXG81DRAFT_21317 [Caulochytrium protostelioides]